MHPWLRPALALAFTTIAAIVAAPMPAHAAASGPIPALPPGPYTASAVLQKMTIQGFSQ